MAQQYDYDLFTIGAGSGGVACSRRAGEYGARVAIAEESRVGGTCVMRGCVPKKLLVYASHVRRELKTAEGFGWSFDGASLDWGALVQHKSAELDRLEGIYHRMLGAQNVELVEGRATLVDKNTVEVGGKKITARRILIATGGCPHVPDIPGAELGITSNEALDLPELPRRVIVVGGGYIGVEFAGIFAGAGAKVTQVLRGYAVLRGFDDDVRSALMEELRASEIDVQTHAVLETLERTSDGLRLRCRGETVHEADAVLWATGRWPNTRGLGLEDLGIACDDHGAIKVDQWSRTSVHGVYSIGDCTDRINLTPVAIADGRALAETLYNDNPTPIDHAGIPTAVFSQPPVATVGLTEEQARATCDGHVDVYQAHFRPMKSAFIGSSTRTLMKLVVLRESDRVLGVHMVGDDAPEIIQGFAVALKAGATKAQLDATVGIHPTSAEEFVTMRAPLDE